MHPLLLVQIGVEIMKSVVMLRLQLQLERYAGRGVEDLSLRKHLGEHGLEGVRGALGGEDCGEESGGVHVTVAHGNHVPGPEQPGEVDGVLLAGDEGEVGREELLHHGRDHHLCPQPPAFKERAVVNAVRLVVQETFFFFFFFGGIIVIIIIRTTGSGRKDDVAVLGALPRWSQHGACGGQYPYAVAGGGGLAGLEVGDAAERRGQGGEDGARVGGGDHGQVRRPGGQLLQGAHVAVVVQALRDQQQVRRRLRRQEQAVHAEGLHLGVLLGAVEEPWRAEVEVADEDGVHQDAVDYCGLLLLLLLQLPHPAVDLQVRQLQRPSAAGRCCRD
ncbi:hypothetical protein QOZ80_5BG0448610 [Eleusine coracana subsp. coracana]|nr:hypothetical protein QOZ80_5BG0448610 [Eleusine coracana subsp. coracana]